MRILILAQYFWPETVGAGVWLHQLATDLVRKGHPVTMVTAFPNYPEGKVLDGYRGRWLLRETVDGVHVIRTYIHATPNKSFWPRAISFGSFCASATVGAFLTSRPDVIYCVIPPLPLAFGAELAGLARRVPVVVNVQDIYPDIAVSLGYLKNAWAIRFFRKMENVIYERAAALTVIGESFRENLHRKGVPPEKIRVIPNWADSASIQPGPRANAFRRKVGCDESFLLVYSGGMGHNTCLETVIEAARLLSPGKFQFVLIGDGANREALQAQAVKLGVNNVRFLPFQPLEEYPQVLAASDAQLVALHESATQMSLPSKVLKIMASGRPVLAVAQPESDLARLVLEATCGIVTPPSNPLALAEAIRHLAENPTQLEAMGRNARQFLLTNFERNHCVAQIESALVETVQTYDRRAVSGRAPGIPEESP